MKKSKTNKLIKWPVGMLPLVISWSSQRLDNPFGRASHIHWVCYSLSSGTTKTWTIQSNSPLTLNIVRNWSARYAIVSQPKKYDEFRALLDYVCLSVCLPWTTRARFCYRRSSSTTKTGSIQSNSPLTVIIVRNWSARYPTVSQPKKYDSVH